MKEGYLVGSDPAPRTVLAIGGFISSIAHAGCDGRAFGGGRGVTGTGLQSPQAKCERAFGHGSNADRVGFGVGKSTGTRLVPCKEQAVEASSSENVPALQFSQLFAAPRSGLNRPRGQAVHAMPPGAPK
eukprot:3047829-Rhodomonas_salina.2